MPGRRPRTEVIRPAPHKVTPIPVGGLDLTLAERVTVLRQRAGYASHAALAQACRTCLPEWVTMNRKVIQEIESGKIPPTEVNDVWLLAIAHVCASKASEVFGIYRGQTPDIDPLADLFDSQLVAPKKGR